MADADCYPVRAQVSMAEGGEAAEGSKQLQEKGPQSVSFAPSRGTSLPGGSTNVVGSQTKRIGTIQPPPDIRAIVHKTAQFVARNGPEFEKRILANEKDNHKFNFLLQNDPYHAYYQQQLEQYRSKERGEEEPKSEDGDGNHAGQQQQQQAESEKQEPPSQTDAERKERERRDMQQRALRRDATGAARALEPPDEAVYSVDIPEDMAALDLDVIKLTAQFVARNGKQFLTELTSREHANPQFAFLKPTHSLFSLFTSLADAYSKVLMPPRGAIERVKRDAEDKEQLLERCLNRLEWEQAQEREQREEEAKAQRERDALARIDWHDFVVADKIEFGDDDDEQLPDPLPKRDVIAQVEGEATETAEAAASVSVAPGFADEEAPYEEQELDEEERQLVEQARNARRPDATQDDMEEVGEVPSESGAIFGPAAPPAEEGEGELKVVKNYQPPGKDRKPQKTQQSSQKVVSPITGEIIDSDKMAEHMHVSLIDPKWKEQREAMLAKIRDVSYANDDEIANNIVGLARTRPDIFGSSDDDMSVAVSNEIQRNSTTADPGSASQQTQEEQLQQHHHPRHDAGSQPQSSAAAPGPPPPLAHAPPPPANAPPPPSTGPPPPAPPQYPPNAESDGVVGKRPREKDSIELSEEEFLERNPSAQTIQVSLPASSSAPHGAVMQVVVDSARESVVAFKQRIAELSGLEIGVQKLYSPDRGYLKDGSTLASYNIGTGSHIEVVDQK